MIVAFAFAVVDKPSVQNVVGVPGADRMFEAVLAVLENPAHFVNGRDEVIHLA